MPNIEGTGKRLVRRPHPPPTTAPLPDDFDAITETRDSTTIYDDAPNSALDYDYYDDITVAPAPAPTSTYTRSPMTQPQPIHAPLPMMSAPASPPRNNPTSPPRQRRAGSPSHSLASGQSPDVRGPRRSDVAALSAGKARSVAGDRDRGAAQQRRSLGAPPPPPLPLLSSSGKGPAMGRNQLVEKMVLEDGPERTISVWREHVSKNAKEAGGSGGAGAGANAPNGDGVANGDGDGRSDLDSHVGRRRVSTDNSRRRVDSLVQGASGSPSVKSKGHRSRESAEFTEVRKKNQMTLRIQRYKR